MAALLAVGLVALAISSESVAGQERPHASNTPTSLFGAFVKLDRKLTNAIDRAERGEHVYGPIKRIERDKLAIVDQQMTAPIDGVAASEWFSDLDCVDIQLEFARLVDGGQLTIPHGGNDQSFVKRRLEVAKRCKQHLENELHKANQQPQCTGHAMLGNIYGGQAHELVSDFTCPKASTEFSLTVPSGYQITGGQASNTASSTGYTCNLNSINTSVACTGNAPAASTTYVQMTTSPNPRTRMMVQLKASFSDATTTSFTLTSQ